jgi:hypothetical protein
MRLEDVDFAQQANTFWAVFLGAFLATVGGIVATQAEGSIRRAERERDAARLFGEILTTLLALIRLAERTKKFGDPYGPITLRMLRAARRELDIYDRNRETLAEIRDHKLRADLHVFMVRLSMPLEGVLEGSAEITHYRTSLRTPGLSADDRQEIERQIELLHERRDQGFEFIVESADDIPDLLKSMGRIARQQFKAYQPVAGDP